MRIMWPDRLDKMLSYVTSSAAPTTWSDTAIQKLFRVKKESARRIMTAVGRTRTQGKKQRFVGKDKLKSFLEDFSPVFTDRGSDKTERSEKHKIARELFANKFARGKEDEKRAAELGDQKTFAVRIDQKFDAPLKQAQLQSGETRKQWVEKAIDDRLNQPKAELILIADFSGIIDIPPSLDRAAPELLPSRTLDDEQCPLPLDERTGQDVELKGLPAMYVPISSIRPKRANNSPRSKKASGSQPPNPGFDFENAAS